jgi:type II secretory pathway pseudopilin PulG
MVVLAIVCMLATLSAPEFLRSIDRARDAITRANLHSLRTALYMYYVDQGNWPQTLDEKSGFVPHYIKEIPNASLGADLPKKTKISASITYGRIPTGTGGWLYDPESGTITVNSGVVDLAGVRYCSY